jgi:hypothetical protein
MNVLQFVSTQVWKALFNKPADSLERSIDHADEFMIVDYEPITSTFVSVPADFGQLSVDAYISGMISGILSGAGFHARVTAHSVRLEEGEHTNTSGSSGGGGGGGSGDASQHLHHLQGSGGGVGTVSSLNPVNLMGSPVIVHSLPPRKDKAVFLVKFSPEVLARDAAMDR